MTRHDPREAMTVLLTLSDIALSDITLSDGMPSDSLLSDIAAVAAMLGRTPSA